VENMLMPAVIRSISAHTSLNDEKIKITRLIGFEQQLLLSVIPTLHHLENGLKLDVRDRNLLLYVSA
jgi:hypothetical protein